MLANRYCPDGAAAPAATVRGTAALVSAAHSAATRAHPGLATDPPCVLTRGTAWYMRLGLACAVALAAACATAAPLVPTADSQVVERLPPTPRSSASTDPAVAVREAKALLDAGRQAGDPRPAGRALARLARWRDDPAAPAPVVLALADTEQYLHQFAPATRRLQGLVARDAAQPQAWLMLATLHRVAGRYDESDTACQALVAQRVAPYGQACTAENQALRGEHGAARAGLQRLLQVAKDAGTRGWLSATLAEAEQRAGQAAASDAAWRQALQSAPDAYTRIAYADFLLDQQRPAEAWAVLKAEPRNDAVLLRLAIAARRTQRPEAAALHAELRARFAQADLRPESSGHERERALAALDLDNQPTAALALAQRNVALQREPIDLWLLARCARAANQPQALAQARQLATNQGLRDARLESL